MFKWITNLFSGKGAVEKIADVVQDYVPGQVTQHKMAIEDQQAGDESQKNAQQLVLHTHDTWIDIVVDAINRLIRPIFSLWAFGVLAGVVSVGHLSNIPPMAWNVIWTIIGFWFGTRMVFKDIPALIKVLKGK